MPTECGSVLCRLVAISVDVNVTHSELTDSASKVPYCFCATALYFEDALGALRTVCQGEDESARISGVLTLRALNYR
jgi:hypothetical protein